MGNRNSSPSHIRRARTKDLQNKDPNNSPTIKPPLISQKSMIKDLPKDNDPKLDFMYKIVRMINKNGDHEHRGDEIDKEICRVLTSNDEIFDAVVASKKNTNNKKYKKYKTKKIKMGSSEDEVETFAVIAEDQYILNVEKTEPNKNKENTTTTNIPIASLESQFDLGSVRVSKTNKTQNVLEKILYGKFTGPPPISELKRRLSLEKKLSLKQSAIGALTALNQKRSTMRLTSKKIEEIIHRKLTNIKPDQETLKIISLPQSSIYLTTISPKENQVERFESKPFEIYIDGQQLDSMSYMEFDSFGHICCKGLTPMFLGLNQDVVIIKNAAKKINYFSVFDGHGFDCQSFLDTLKLYSAIMILGDKKLEENPRESVENAFAYIQTLIEEIEDSVENFCYSSLAVFRLLFIKNRYLLH